MAFEGDWLQHVKAAREGGESLAAILEGLGSLLWEEELALPKAASEEKKLLAKMRKLVNQAHTVARKEGL